MASDREDALHWEGDDEPAPTLPKGWSAVGKGSERVAADDEPGAGASGVQTTDGGVPALTPQGIGNVALLSLGVLGGVYLLFSIGWLVGGMRLQDHARFLVSDALYVPWMWVAVAAPALWFAAAWMLTRGNAGWVRAVALVAGVVLLVPWPFVMVGAVGA